MYEQKLKVKKKHGFSRLVSPMPVGFFSLQIVNVKNNDIPNN